MPAPEALLAPPHPPAPRSSLRRISGWGGTAAVDATVIEPRDEREMVAALELARSVGRPGVLARGAGRSYGDAAQCAGGTVLSTARMRAFTLDARTGTVVAQAGATLGEILREAVPSGWMLPVVPGTQHVSVAGAVAGDVHGKNHRSHGTFSRWVRELQLLTGDGRTVSLRPGEALFDATAGGMGLTGVILSVSLELIPVGGPLLSTDTDRVHGLDDVMAALLAGGGSHRVAWIDLIVPERVRGVVTRAEHLPGGGRPAERAPAPTVAARVEVPEGLPAVALRPATIRAFNELRFRRAPRRERGRIQTLAGNLFPLDALDRWPRLYGPDGLVQYQFAVPFGAEAALLAVLRVLWAAHAPVYLAVLKVLGRAGPGPLSFPLPGWTFALDLPAAAPGLQRALDACDDVVARAGGRVYLSKDARLGPGAVDRMYPRLADWRAVRDAADPDGVWCSDLARRTGLIGARA